MIARINGMLIDKSTSQVVVEASGVGYLIFIPLSTYYELPEENNPIKLNIHTSLKQDSISLFGFATLAERDIFQVLLAVSGIGPKLALNILSGISVDDMIRAIRDRDLRRLTNVPGVGKKTAERMVLELRDKVIKLGLEGAHRKPQEMSSQDGEFRDDAISALVNLGYRHQAAQEVVDSVLAKAAEPLSMDSLLKQSLKLLTG